MLKHILFGLLIVPCVLLAMWLSAMSFDRVQDLRELERVPRSAAFAVIPGEVNLQGTVSVGPGGLVPPDVPEMRCAYYLYTIQERQTRNNKRRWVTVHEEERFVAFELVDASGQVRVVPGDQVSFDVDEDRNRTDGNMRYSTSCLGDGDPTFIFGFATLEAGSMVVGFDHDGAYTPIISQDGETSERASMGTLSLVFCWLAILALSFAVVFFCWTLRIHRIMAYLTLVSLAVGGGLVVYGVNMLETDLRSAHERVQRTRAAAEDVLAVALEGTGWDGDWTTVPALDAIDSSGRLARIRADVARSSWRFNDVLERFPERLLAPRWDVTPQPDVALSDSEQALAEALDSEYSETAVGSAFGAILGLVGLALCALLTFFGFRTVKTKRYIENLPTSKTAGVAFGFTEIGGQVELETGQKLSGPLSSRDCVYYHYKVQERRRSGKNYKWVTVDDVVDGCRFACVDDEGRLPIIPTGAEVISKHKSSRRSGKRRYTEVRLEPGDMLYGLGTAELDPNDSAKLVLARGEKELPFLLSNHSERNVMFIKSRRSLMLLNVALNGLVFAALMYTGVKGSFAATDYIAAALLAPLYLGALFTGLMFNDLVFLKQRVDRAWSNIDVSLKKRADLLPNVERVVKQFLGHEQSLQARLAELRSNYGQGGFSPTTVGQLVTQEQAVVNQLMTAVEAHPDLKAQILSSKAMSTLITLENELALMRQGYNDAVERYNTKIHHFPEMLLAKLGRHRDRSLFQADLEVRTVPVIEAGALQVSSQTESPQ